MPISDPRVGLRSGMRRRALLGRGAVAAPLVAACGQPVAPAPPSQTGAPKRTSTYTVRVQVWAELQDEAAYDAIRGDFNAQQSDVRIENDPTPPGPAYYEKFATNLAAGTVADLVSFQGWQWQEYAARGALQAVDELAARDKWTAPWPGDEASELQTRFRGKRYLSPAHAGTLLMYYAKEPFDRAGIPYPREGWTYTEFQDLNRRLTRQIDGRQVYAYQWSGGYLRNTPWWRMNRHQEWDRIAEPRKGAWNAGPVIEAFQYQLYDSQYKLRCSPTQQLLDAEPGEPPHRAGGRGDEGGGAVLPAPHVGAPGQAGGGHALRRAAPAPRARCAGPAHEPHRGPGHDPPEQGQRGGLGSTEVDRRREGAAAHRRRGPDVQHGGDVPPAVAPRRHPAPQRGERGGLRQGPGRGLDQPGGGGARGGAQPRRRAWPRP